MSPQRLGIVVGIDGSPSSTAAVEWAARCGNHVGDVVLMDEYVGSRHVRMVGEVIEAVPGEKIVWRLPKADCGCRSG